MKIHHRCELRVDKPRLALAIGFFDGFHRGHQTLLTALEPYLAPNVALAVLSFRAHPLSYLRPAATPELLVSTEQRVNLLARSGVDELYLVPFDQQIATMDAHEFIQHTLIDQLGVVAVAVGASFRFGKNRTGDVQLAQALLTKAGVAFQTLEHVLDAGERISSSRIRGCIAAAQIEEAEQLLGHSYCITGVVELGAGRGHDLGFPTANLRLPDGLVLPPNGVYTATAQHNGLSYRALISIGTNPTFSGTLRTVEVWMQNFDKTIYGEYLSLENIRFVRGQQKFANVDALKQQMLEDVLALGD